MREGSRHPPPLPSQSQVAFESGHPPHFPLPVAVTRRQSWASVAAVSSVTRPGHPVTGHPASSSPVTFRWSMKGDAAPLNPGATRGRHPHLGPNRGWTAGQWRGVGVTRRRSQTVKVGGTSGPSRHHDSPVWAATLLLRCPSRLALQPGKLPHFRPPVTITSGQSWASVVASRSVARQDSGAADCPNVAATRGHETPSHLNIRPPFGVTGQRLRGVGAPPSPLPDRSRVALQPGNQLHFSSALPASVVATAGWLGQSLCPGPGCGDAPLLLLPGPSRVSVG